MNFQRTVAVTMLIAAAAGAQTLDNTALGRGARALQASSTAAAEAKAAAAKLIGESTPLQNGGQSGEARRRLANAYTLLNGKAWDAREEFFWSLRIRADKVVADSGSPVTARLTQYYSSANLGRAGLKLVVSFNDVNDGKL